MKLDILVFGNRGSPPMEYVHLVVSEDCLLEECMLSCMREVPPGYLRPRPELNFWWPADWAVKAGDEVFLYTRQGTPRRVPLADGRTQHFFYWNLDQAIWDKPERRAVIFHIDGWDSKRAA